jgi:hypothetical protein
VTTKSRLGRLAKLEAIRQGQCAGPKSPYITLEMRRLLADIKARPRRPRRARLHGRLSIFLRKAKARQCGASLSAVPQPWNGST